MRSEIGFRHLDSLTAIRLLWRSIPHTVFDHAGDALRIPSDAVDHAGRKGMQKLQTHEIHSRFAIDDTARVSRLAILGEYG